MLSLTHSHIAVYCWLCSLSVCQLWLRTIYSIRIQTKTAHCTQRPLFVSFAIDGVCVRVDLFGRGHTIKMLAHSKGFRVYGTWILLTLTHAFEHTYKLIQQMSASRRQHAEPICLLEPPDKHTHTRTQLYLGCCVSVYTQRHNNNHTVHLTSKGKKTPQLGNALDAVL